MASATDQLPTSAQIPQTTDEAYGQRIVRDAHLDDALTKAASETHSLPHTLLKWAYQPWFEYFLATTNSQAHHEGRQAKINTVNALHELSAANINLVASTVAAIKPHNTVETASDKILKKNDRSSKLS
ncbi:MAG: hypothetical protein M1837_006005 [Sclerophora amabilis]|nr:MAG: hypothetical protein M1837_006005 [Sclerophora amabilis]